MANTTDSNPMILDTEDLTGPIHTGRVKVTSITAFAVAGQTITVTDKSGNTIFAELLGNNGSAERQVNSWINGIGTYAVPAGGDSRTMIRFE